MTVLQQQILARKINADLCEYCHSDEAQEKIIFNTINTFFANPEKICSGCNPFGIVFSDCPLHGEGR